MEMATAGLEPAKETRSERVASRRCAPDFAKVGGGRVGGPEKIGRRVGGGSGQMRGREAEIGDKNHSENARESA